MLEKSYIRQPYNILSDKKSMIKNLASTKIKFTKKVRCRIISFYVGSSDGGFFKSALCHGRPAIEESHTSMCSAIDHSL